MDDTEVHQKQKKNREGFALDYAWPSVGMVLNAGTPYKKCFFQQIFRGLRQGNIKKNPHMITYQK